MKNALIATMASILTAIVSPLAWTADARYGDWFVDLGSPNKKFAYTGNQAGEVFGQLCTYDSDGNNCVYVFSMDLECEEGNEYPVLVNSDVGASHQRIACGGKASGASYRYYFYFDEIHKTIEDGSRIAIVFPTKSDQFRVLRFSLIGSETAIRIMNEAAERMFKEYRPAKETLL